MNFKVPFLDLKLSDPNDYEVTVAAVGRVLRHGRLVMGPEIDCLESEIAAFCGRKFCISVGSGTDALFLGLKALDIGPGDEVITTALSWIATANAISLTGATPIFADIKDDLNIDLESVKSLLTSRTKAVLAVDYTGRIADMEGLSEFCMQNDLYLVEDGSQAFGAIRNGKRAGSFGILSAISHNPMKVFAAIGEAGSILCDDQELRERLISLRYNGTINREICIQPSLNGRMDTIQASVLHERLKTLPLLIRRRRENAKYYIDRIKEVVEVPEEAQGETQVYYTFTIRTPSRDALMDFLAKRGIETKVQHRLIMPEHPAYKPAKGQFSRAEDLSKIILSIPVHEKITSSQRKFVADSILEFFG